MNKAYTMKTNTLLTLGAGALACIALAPLSAQAGGIELYEMATPDIGLASAGYAARAQDASTLFKNPAGMSLLEGTQVQSGLQLLYGNVEFSPSGGTSGRLGNGDGGNAIKPIPGGSFFAVTDVTDGLKAGFGMFSYFGLSENYENDWVGRYYVQDSTLVGLSLMPAASYKVNDWLSVGGGPNVMFGYLKSKMAVNNLTPGLGDGQMKLRDNQWGVGGVGGILIEPAKGTRIGVTYVSQVKLDFSDKPNFDGLGPGLSAALTPTPKLDLGMTVPQSVMVGVYHEFSPKWAVMADVGWQDWSQFGEVDVGVETDASGTRTVTKNLHYQDTWHGALGAQYKYSERWRFSTGVAYDTSAVEDKYRAVILPMGRNLRFGLGAEWQATKQLSLGAAWDLAWIGTMSVNQGSEFVSGTTIPTLRGRVAGSYNDAWLSFFTANLTYKF